MLGANTLYDALNKTVIGYLILLPVAIHLHWKNFIPPSTQWEITIIVSYLTGFLFWGICLMMLHHIRTTGFTKKHMGNNYLPRIKESYEESFNKFATVASRSEFSRANMIKDPLGIYYMAYVHVDAKGLMGPVHTLEALSEFSRNLVWVAFWWAGWSFSAHVSCYLTCHYDRQCHLCVSLALMFGFLIFGAMMFVIRPYIERKINEYIWDTALLL